jgi:glycosyltransferase involved in cell wall biosynthesis
MVRELGIGGCERDLTKVAIGLDRSRFEPHVGCFISEGLRSGELRARGIPVVKFEVPSFLSVAALRAAQHLGTYIRRHRIKVVHAFDMPTDFFAIPAARLYGTPAVIASNLSSRDLVRNKRDLYLLRLVDKAAHMVVVNSRAIQSELVGQGGIPPERTLLNYNGVDASIFYPEPHIRKVFPEASIIVGAVCALRPEKRMDLLLEAFARVRRLDQEMRLLIVGSGPMLSDLERRCAKLDLQSFCHLEPSKVDVAEWMRSIDIFVMASDSESFPNALLEAMACGCSVIGSRVGGVPELVADGQNGLLFERGNAQDLAAKLAQLISNHKLRRRLAQEAVRTARESFSIEATVARLEKLYASLLGRKLS